MNNKPDKHVNWRKISLLLIVGAIIVSANSFALESVSINDTSAAPDKTVITPILIWDVSDIVRCSIDLTYDPSVLVVENIGNSSFDTFIPDIDNVTGITKIDAFQQKNPGINTDIQLCEVTFRATGNPGMMSNLNLENIRIEKTGDIVIPATPVNGLFRIPCSPMISNVSPKGNTTIKKPLIGFNFSDKSGPGSESDENRPANTVRSAQGPDLIGEIVEAPKYIKKSANGNIHVSAVFRIINTGQTPVNEGFTIEGNFVGKSASFTISDSIDVAKNITYYVKTNIIPGYTETKVVLEGITESEKRYRVTTGGDINTGNYTIGIDIDINNDVDETNESNNHIETNAVITYPDLVPLFYAKHVNGAQLYNSTAFKNVIPGEYDIVYGVINKGKVFADPAKLTFTCDNDKFEHNIPELQPGEVWNQTLNGISIDNSSTTFTLKANANLSEVETNYTNNFLSCNCTAFSLPTVYLPHVTGITGEITPVPVTITNLSATVTDLLFPFLYDPSVCTVDSVITPDGVIFTEEYGSVCFTTTKDLEIRDSMEIAQINLRARSDFGRSTTLTSDNTAFLKTGDNYTIGMEIYDGKFVQANITNAEITIFTPPKGSVDHKQTIVMTINNPQYNPVTVDAKLNINGVEIWNACGINLGPLENKKYSIEWQPQTDGAYTITGQIAGDMDNSDNEDSVEVFINGYILNITSQNRNDWQTENGYNRSTYLNQYFWLGTGFTANQAGMINASLIIRDSSGNPIDTKQNNSAFVVIKPEKQIFSTGSTSNTVVWHRIMPNKAGLFTYSIQLESRGKRTSVNGTIDVKEPYVDIKVLENTVVSGETGEIEFPVFRRIPSEERTATLSLSAGAEGRTLEGLQYLIEYPHNCPEQIMSPALAAIRVKQYYIDNGKLTDRMNTSLQNTVQRAIDVMSADNGFNAQQLPGKHYGDQSGGWSWSRNSTPSLFYTLYPNYVITELLCDNDPDYWNAPFTQSEIDLNKSVQWLIAKQDADGSWHDYGYIKSDVVRTGFIMDTFARESQYLDAATRDNLKNSMNKSLDYLLNVNYGDQNNKACAFGIYGLKAIRSMNIVPDKNHEIDQNILEIRDILLTPGRIIVDGDKCRWDSGDDDTEYTAHAVLALNMTGLSADDPRLKGGIGHLVSRYDSDGRWKNTRVSAAVINTLIAVQPHEDINFNVDIEIQNPSGTVVKTLPDLAFTNDAVNYRIPLNQTETDRLYEFGTENGTGKVIISGKSDSAEINPAKLVAAITSREKVPKSLAEATIEDRYIDPIATDFTLDISVPSGLKKGDEGYVGFTMNNNFPGSEDQTVMILEIPVDGKISFNGPLNGSSTAFYETGGSKHFLSHRYNATEGRLYVYPGSDDEGKPCVAAGELKTFFAPLKFGSSGNKTVEARLYPMYNDEWMAIGCGSNYVSGYGNLTLNVVDHNGDPAVANIYIDSRPAGSGVDSATIRLIEGEHAVSIVKGTKCINTTIIVAPEEKATFTGRIPLDSSIPHIVTFEGAAGDVRIMPPAIEDNTDETSDKHWNAATMAIKSFNSSIVGSGGRATIEVDIPTITRNIGTVFVNDSIGVHVHNNSGWYEYTDLLSGGGSLVLNNVELADIDRLNITFRGRKLGDVNNDGRIRTSDALLIVKNGLNDNFNSNQKFYGDVNDDGTIQTSDAFLVVQYRLGQIDSNYNSL